MWNTDSPFWGDRVFPILITLVLTYINSDMATIEAQPKDLKVGVCNRQMKGYYVRIHI